MSCCAQQGTPPWFQLQHLLLCTLLFQTRKGSCCEVCRLQHGVLGPSATDMLCWASTENVAHNLSSKAIPRGRLILGLCSITCTFPRRVIGYIASNRKDKLGRKTGHVAARSNRSMLASGIEIFSARNTACIKLGLQWQWQSVSRGQQGKQGAECNAIDQHRAPAPSTSEPQHALKPDPGKSITGSSCRSSS